MAANAKQKKMTASTKHLLDPKEQKRRLKVFLRSMGGILLLGIAYYLVVTLTGFSLPCLIRLATGKLCPGCGISRMCLRLIHGDLKGAFYCNRLLFVLLPVILIYGIRKEYLYIRYDDTRMSNPEMVGILIVCVITIAFWIMRNMAAFSYLQPLE